MLLRGNDVFTRLNIRVTICRHSIDQQCVLHRVTSRRTLQHTCYISFGGGLVGRGFVVHARNGWSPGQLEVNVTPPNCVPDVVSYTLKLEQVCVCVCVCVRACVCVLCYSVHQGSTSLSKSIIVMHILLQMVILK